MITPGRAAMDLDFPELTREVRVFSFGVGHGESSYFMHSKDTGVVFSNKHKVDTGTIAKVAALKMSGNEIPDQLMCRLLLGDIQSLFSRNQVGEALEKFSELKKLMEDTDLLAVQVQDEVGTLYFNYVKYNQERVNINDLTKMLEVLENVNVSPKLPVHRKAIVQGAIKGLKDIKLKL